MFPKLQEIWLKTGQLVMDQLNAILLDSTYSKIVKKTLEGKGLIRFSKNDQPFYFRQSHTSKRKPLDTKKNVDNFLEKVREKQYPHIPSRQKAIFCFPQKLGLNKIKKIRISSLYGPNVYLIFFKNDARVFQSKDILDFSTSFVDFSISSFLDVSRKMESGSPVYDDAELDALEHIGRYFKNANLSIDQIDFDNFLNEVVIETSGYWAFDLRFLGTLCEGKDFVGWLKKMRRK